MRRSWMKRAGLNISISKSELLPVSSCSAQHLTEDGTKFETMAAQSDGKVQARHVRHGAEQRLEVRRTVVKAGRGAVDGGRSLIGEPPLVPLS